VLAGGNAAALRQADGAWEVMQFAQAELIDGNTYRLSRLLRGQAGSEPAMTAALPAGAAFVLLDRKLVPIATGLDRLDRPMPLRVVGSGRSHDDASAVALTVTPDATALKPWAPVQFRATRQVDGVHITWIRRSRIDGDGWGIEVPLAEGVEAYRLEILSGVSVVRTLDVTRPQTLYAIADEIADFGAPQPTLQVRVAQISSTVGSGHVADVTLTV
ncbi:MAG: transfer agent orfg15, partial [Tardiphaga sp.]|nr:transfer agent orfg15 [Tardiphaga sp.]